MESTANRKCADCQEIESEIVRLAGEVGRLSALNSSLAARIAAASDVLSRVAERGGSTRLAVRFLAALEKIATGEDGHGVTTIGEARKIAAEAAWIYLPWVNESKSKKGNES